MIIAKIYASFLLPFVMGAISVVYADSNETKRLDERDLSTLTPDAAEADAANDIASGKIRVYFLRAGGVPVEYAAGISDEQQHLIKNLPRELVGPGGCVIDHDTEIRYEYAYTYNSEVIKYLSAREASSNNLLQRTRESHGELFKSQQRAAEQER